MSIVIRNKFNFHTYEFSEIKDYWQNNDCITILLSDGSICEFSKKEFLVGIVYV